MQKIIFDAHQDILIHEQDKNKTVIQTGFREILKSSIKLVVASVFLLPEEMDNKDEFMQAKLAEKQIRDYLKIIKRDKNLILVNKIKDLEKAMKNNLTGILLHIEGIDFINPKSLYLIDDFYDLGLRSVGLVWGKSNYIGGYSGGKNGLTEFGKKVVAKLNQKNMIIDLAHTNKETFYDVLKMSQKPIMVSHGNCYSLCKDKRNFSKKQLELLNKIGGVQGIFFSGKYVSKKKDISLEDLIDQFEYSYKISPEMTMLGSDFGGISSGFVEDIRNVGQLEKIVEMVEDRLGAEARERISYKNFFDFLKKII